jgi:hypothetical protein
MDTDKGFRNDGLNLCLSAFICGWVFCWFYLNREKREMSQKGKDGFRVFWRFSRFKIMVPYF